MSEENEKTLKVYDKLAKKYLKQTVLHNKKNSEKAKKQQKWLEEFFREGFGTLPEGAKILEVGAADGENSEVLSKFGFEVTASDVAEDFLEAIKKKGFEPVKFNVLVNEFPGKFDGVLLYRVFVHFTKEDFRKALSRIFENLNEGGRVIFNVMNKKSEGRSQDGWVDFEGEYHLGEERFYQHFEEEELLAILEETGFSVVKLEKNGGESGDKWFFVVAEKMRKINPEIRDYVETEILVQYDSEAGHGVEHINYVIERSLKFSKETEANVDMVYVIAAYHDIGRKVDNARHEIESAKIFLEDERMKEFFGEEERKIIAEAIEDHRASAKHLPRSVYGRIVSSADRNTSVEEVLDRIFDYTKSLHPDFSEDEVIEDSRKHLREKYKTDGYAAKKMFFFDPKYEGFLKEIEEITRDSGEYKKKMKEFNKKKGKK